MFLLNPRYPPQLKFFVLLNPVDANNYSDRVGEVYRLMYKFGGEVLSEFQVRSRGIRWKDVRIVANKVNIKKFSSSGGGVVNVTNVRKWIYDSLRNVYNSLRFARTQLRYGKSIDKW